MVMGKKCANIHVYDSITYRKNKINSMSVLNKHAIQVCFGTTNQEMSIDEEIWSSTFVNPLLFLTHMHPRDVSGKDNPNQPCQL